jgi:transcriptional regulator with XRE-family HTH domain
LRLIPGSETARRVRAAIAYSGLEQVEIIERTGMRMPTLRRIVARADPRAASLEELYAIADACGVPRVFMEEGFAPLVASATALEQRVDELARQLSAVLDERQDLLAQMAQMAGEAVARALESGELPTAREGPATATRRAAGARREAGQ